MKRLRFEIVFGLILAVLFFAVCAWQSPSLLGNKLTKAEIDRYIAKADRQLTTPGKEEMLARIRAWAEADDGKPVYMLNMMRYFKELHRYPGAPDFQGTPLESNGYYEDQCAKLLLKSGTSVPLIATPQGKCLLDPDPKIDSMNRVLVVRYPNRAAFLKLLSDPAYAPIAPYKLMALEVNLLPLSADLTIPDPRLIFGALFLVLFLGVGWFRASRRQQK